MTETATWLIETTNLTRVYGDGVGIRALDGVDLRVAPGELLAVMGPSGSGKSTLLNIIGALDQPDDGRVIINGHDLATIKDKDAFRARTVGFVFQLHNLLPTLTARENVEIPLMGQMSHAQRHHRSEELMELVHLSDRMNHLPGQLSGGQRQRVAIARALANNPPLILADEPTGALDTASSQDLMQLLQELNQSQGMTIVVVTHDPSIARLTRRVVVMQDGKIAQEDLIGSPLEEDLKMWLRTGLGKHLLQGDHSVFKQLRLHVSTSQVRAVQKLLEQAGGGKIKQK